MTPVGENGSVVPPAADPQTIRAQVEKLLASPEMRSSRRCQLFLRHVVEAVLDRREEQLKERAIGIAVFGRAPGYSTNEDTIVRHTATEVRKRLAQYYAEPGHEHEVRIILAPVGYLPEFCAATAEPQTDAPLPRQHKPRRRRTVATAVLMVVAGGSALWYQARLSRTDLDRFWAPFADDPGGIVICVGQPTRVYRFVGPRTTELHNKLVGTSSATPVLRPALTQTSLTLDDLSPIGKRFLYLGDALCLSKLTALLEKKGKSVRIRVESMTPYEDLRGKPVVLIGLANNKWTPRLTTELRFYLENNFAARHYELRDRERPGVVVGVAENDKVDYAVVNRVFDVTTERPIVSAAGTTHLGTLAAGDFLSNATYMRNAFRGAHREWHRQNIQVVLKTRIVGGMAGPPEVVALHFWGGNSTSATARPRSVSEKNM